MEQKRPVQSELQSKTLIINEVDGIDDMLSDLNKGRGQLEKKERSFDWRTALIVLLVIVVLAETIWLLVR
ncbi:MAG TPA: hypothetical protein P5077_08535 [bacterium]|nr:hypothetical protein [bacterium]